MEPRCGEQLTCKDAVPEKGYTDGMYKEEFEDIDLDDVWDKTTGDIG